MDVLVYSALNEQAALKKEIAERQQCLFDLKANTGGAGGGAAGDPVTMAKEWLESGEKEHWACPEDTSKWKIYEGTGWTGGLKVCDTSGYYRCGRNCTWTVPSGVTQARFQIWGAGGGANKPPCCCGHTVFGSTGAYASVIVPVQAGWTYTLCAGCAYCCYGYTTESARRWSGCHSFVQGCKLENFCADGGQAEMGNWMAMYGAPCTCRFHYYTSGNGGQFCNCGTDWCWNGESMTGTVPFVPGSGYHGTIKDIENPTAENVIYGLRGMWPKSCFDSSHYGFDQHPPIYGFLGQTGDCTMCCPCYTSGNCCGCQCNATNTQCLRTPGAGGWSSHAMGGGNGLYGDSGRLGMVCVSYK